LLSVLENPAFSQSDPQTTFPSTPQATPTKARPGKYQLGPFYLTPHLRFGPISYDSNVFYSATEVQDDVIVAMGPGLDIVLPANNVWRFYANGGLDYLYFVRTASQRRFVGEAAAGVLGQGARTELSLEESYRDTYGRPGYDVDERVQQTEEATELLLDRGLVGRLRLGLRGFRERATTDSDQDYLGTDFASALTVDSYLVAAELGLGVSVKTSLVARGEYGWNRFPVDPARDNDRGLLAGGVRTDATALIAGRALVGRRSYRPKGAQGTRSLTYVDVDATVGSSRTRVGGGYTRDLQDAFFLPEDGFPAQLVETKTLKLEKRLSARFDLRAFGRETTYKTESPITIVPSDGPPQTSVRNDKNRDAGLDLGYRFGSSFRVAITATYRDRDSTFSTFNVEGLLVGFNAQLNPDLPWID
jgi:hypothetical protein